MKPITLCLTNFNRTHMLRRSFAQVRNDPRISEIIIRDDCSTDPEVWKYLGELHEEFPELIIVRNDRNRGMGINKCLAISYANRDGHALIFDSDNILTPAYLDALEVVFDGITKQYADVILMPSKAAPNFDYSKFSGQYFSKINAGKNFGDRAFDCLMNTCNYVVPVKNYIETFLSEIRGDMKGADTIWFNYLWLKAGYYFYVVPNMEYDHLVHDGSGWRQDASENIANANRIQQLIKQLV